MECLRGGGFDFKAIDVGSEALLCLFVCLYVCMFVCMPVFLYVYVFLFCLFVCLFVCRRKLSSGNELEWCGNP